MRRIAQWQVNEILKEIQNYFPNEDTIHKFIESKMIDIQKEPIGQHCFSPSCKKVMRCIICCDKNFWKKGNLGEIILLIFNIVLLILGLLRIFSISRNI